MFCCFSLSTTVCKVWGREEERKREKLFRLSIHVNTANDGYARIWNGVFPKHFFYQELKESEGHKEAEAMDVISPVRRRDNIGGHHTPGAWKTHQRPD